MTPRRHLRALAPFAVAVLLGASGCGGDDEPSTSGSGAGGGGSGPGSTSSGGSSKADELLEALGKSTWSALQTRDGEERAYELTFDASEALWGEVRNPYGPARHSETRQFVVDADGHTVQTVLVDPDTGDVDTWDLEILEGSPRRLRVQKGDRVETFAEKPWPLPDSGLTAEVRVFEANGAVADAFCTSGFDPFDFSVIFDYARGASGEAVLGTDRVAGAPILTWHDVDDQFAVTDVDGFDFGTLGGTELSDQNNFFVWYRGTVQHPGGTIEIRERDDTVEDGVIALLGDDVGTNNPDAKMFFVHGFLTNDDETETWSFPPGEVPIEIIMIRCNVDFVDVDVEMSLGGGPFRLVGLQPTLPLLGESLFPKPF